MSVKPKPDDVEIPEGDVWEEMTPYRRWYYRNREDEKERTRQQRKDKRQWFNSLKQELSCNRCGFSEHAAALDFHHPDEDGSERVSPNNMVNDNYSKEKIRNEISDLEVLCANCHRIEHN